MGHLLGYARVFTADQQQRLQVGALERAGSYRVFTDSVSGAPCDRTSSGSWTSPTRRHPAYLLDRRSIIASHAMRQPRLPSLGPSCRGLGAGLWGASALRGASSRRLPDAVRSRQQLALSAAELESQGR